jgi:hypothetical protein
MARCKRSRWEPVLPFFGIVDFLQVDLRGGGGVAL